VSPALLGVIAFAGALSAERLVELGISRRHAEALRARGAVEHGRGHFPLFVLLHTLLPLGMIAEVAFVGARPGALWPLWLSLFLLAQALRIAAIRALGPHWNVRVLVVPGAALVRSGPYRWLRHPNYLAVAIELLAAPLLFGAWRTAITASLLNALALAVRIRCEEKALASARS
jgi:methyltransferase